MSRFDEMQRPLASPVQNSDLQPAIEVRHVSKHFGTVHAVRDLSFSVPSGSIYGFLGPNGSGKSTTLRMIMGLIRPDAGQISLFGDDLSSHRAALMGRVGCMIEKPDFYTYLNGLENLQLLARAAGLTRNTRELEALLDRVGLQGRGRHKVKTYSHGMKQRLGLAQALLHNPDLIILDEPNTGLDPQGIIDLRNMLVELNREQGKTILFSSHILSEVQEICHHLVVIHKGQALVQGRVDDLLSDQDLRVRVELADEDRSLQAFLASAWAQHCTNRNGRELEFRLSREQIRSMVQDLSAAGAGLLRVEYRNQLEDYFLQLTQS